jgi:hypothetical protein
MENGVFEREKVLYERGMGGTIIDLITIDEKSKCTFIENHFIGSFLYENGSTFISGDFDSNGFMNKIWRVNWTYEEIPYEEVRYYKNGYCYKLIYRNLSTGEILNKFDSTVFINKIDISNIQSNTIIKIDSIQYKVLIINDRDISSKVFEDLYNEKLRGQKYIYKAFGLWICSKGVYCHPFMSHRKVDFRDGSYLYEIEYGTIPIEVKFEKSILINKNDE